MQNGDSAIAAYFPSRKAGSRMATIVLLLTIGAILESARLSSLKNPEIWGHIRAGNWILENQSWPGSGLFSQAAGLHWRDFSWGYDLLSAAAYRTLGLRAVPALLMLFRGALAAVTFLLAGGRRGNFRGAVALSAVAQFALMGIGPDPVNVSMIFFGAELLMLMAFRGSANFRPMLLLPFLFFVWANLDLGVVYGLGLLALFLIASCVERMSRAADWGWLERSPAEIPLGKAFMTGGACLAASLLNPYGYHVYETFWSIQTSAANRNLPGYTAMRFHHAQDYVVLLLAMGAFLSLGLRRSRDAFALLALVGCGIVSFHSQKENWLVALVAVVVIGEGISQIRGSSVSEARPTGSRWAYAAGGLALVAIFASIAILVPGKRDALLAKVAEDFPVRACDYIREHQLPSPLFNSYGWGSFVVWYLPEYPVAIDQRRGLYAEDDEMDYFKVMNAEMPYQSFPPMRQARTLLLDKVTPMGEALREVQGFHVAYEDGISVVLIHETASGAQPDAN
jgi:hypothetical protein